MKTSINLPSEELKSLLEFTGAKTKNQAINLAVKEFNRRQRLERLARKLGKFQEIMSADELKRMREDAQWDQDPSS